MSDEIIHYTHTPPAGAVRPGRVITWKGEQNMSFLEHPLRYPFKKVPPTQILKYARIYCIYDLEYAKTNIALMRRIEIQMYCCFIFYASHRYEQNKIK